MKKLFFISLITIFVVFGLGCGSESQATPADTPPSSVSESHPIQDKEDHFSYGGNGSLQDFQAWASRCYPDAQAGIAYVGYLDFPAEYDFIWQDLRTDGFFPFISQIDISSHIAGKFQMNGTLWCAAPSNSESIVKVYDFSRGERGEILYTGKPGEPVLLLCDMEDINASLEVELTTPQGKSASVFPQFDPQSERLQPYLPKDSSIFDFTVYPGEGSAFDWQFYNTWEITDSNIYFTGENAPLEIRIQLDFKEDGTADYCIYDISRTPAAKYHGTWERIDLNHISLDVTLSEGKPAMLDGKEFHHIQGIYKTAMGMRDSLLIIPEESSFPLAPSHYPASSLPILPAAFTRYTEGLLPSWNDEMDEVLYPVQSALLNYHRQYDYVDGAVLRRIENNQMLFELYCDVQAHRQGKAWYWIDPYTLIGKNYVTGNPIDFNPYLAVEEIGMDIPDESLLCQYALDYYASLYDYRPQTALVDSIDEAGFYVIHIFDDMEDHTATYAWYVIDPYTMQGYDMILGNKIDFYSIIQP